MGDPTAGVVTADVRVDARTAAGPLETWRHSVGHGGINSRPLPDRVVQGLASLRPRLVRVFLQEFLQPYPEHGRFDWSRLDPYMGALQRTGATVVASLCLKPAPLFPHIDHAVWQPSDRAEWQRVVHEVVRRYSVDRPVVTHWEVGNETDIGEQGGCPYLIPDPEDYTAFYQMAVEPILQAFPQARVGGPATCWVDNEPLPGFVARCRERRLPLHFVTWHRYDGDPAAHAAGVRRARELLQGFADRPEMMVTEWGPAFSPLTTEETALAPERAALVASTIHAFIDAGLDWSFYYHAWDQVCYPEEFAPFFSQPGIDAMVEHWNETPHRFGLFGVEAKVRPQYFVFRMLGQLGDERLAAESSDATVEVLAGRDERGVGALLTRRAEQGSPDAVVTVRLEGLGAGAYHLTVSRIDRERRWSDETLELSPVESRPLVAPVDLRVRVRCPAPSVTLVRLERR